MKRTAYIFLLLVMLIAISACSATANDQTVTSVIDGLKAQGFAVDIDKVDKSILKGDRTWLTLNGEGNISIYLYRNNAQMEKDAANLDAGGTTYKDGLNEMKISWVSLPHFYKKDNIIVNYVGEDKTIIDVLETIVGPQFAGYSE